MARCEGEHLVCSPCGKVAGRERCHRLAEPGGAAVALAENQESDYTVKKFQAWVTRLSPCQYLVCHVAFLP